MSGVWIDELAEPGMSVRPYATGRAPKDEPGVTQRQAIRALSDHGLIEAMRAGDARAWAEFFVRFQPLLEEFARSQGIPAGDWNECIVEVLEDVALRLTAERAAPPADCRSYLVKAVARKYAGLQRAAVRRAQRHERAARGYSNGAPDEELVVTTALSEDRLRASQGVERPSLGRPSNALAGLIEAVADTLTPEERQLLEWRVARIPARTIADWVGSTEAAVTKRLWRLSARLREAGYSYIRVAPDAQRRELQRLLRRAGHPEHDAAVTEERRPRRVAERNDRPEYGDDSAADGGKDDRLR
ncbi:MAG: RNA polymerase sigma factor [Gemmatimonadaceae bacterium]